MAELLEFDEETFDQIALLVPIARSGLVYAQRAKKVALAERGSFVA
jgi:hypothetical protein